MTGLRLGDFQRVGLEARTGVIEQTGAPGKEKLANTGTGWAKFTEGVASLFSRSAANAQRQVAAQNRQQAALDSFRAALTDRYGETVADAALQRAGLHPGAASMTWAQGSRALGTAEALAQHHRAITRGYTLDHLSRGPDGGFSDAFRAVCQARGVDPGTLSRAQLRAYDRSFREAVQMRSDGGNVRLSHDDVQRLASQSLRRVAALGDVGLAEAGRRREAFVQCIGKAIAQVAGGADGGRVAATLKEANEALVAWMAAEGEEVSADAVKEFRDLGMNEAIGRLSDPGMARRALRVGLGDPGSLRAVAVVAGERASAARSTAGLESMARLMGTAASLVGQLGRHAGSLGATREEDGFRLADRGGLSARQLQATTAALQRIEAEDVEAARRAEAQIILKDLNNGVREPTILHLANSNESSIAADFQRRAGEAGQGDGVRFIRDVASLRQHLREEPDPDAILPEDDGPPEPDKVQQFLARWIDPPDGGDPPIPLSPEARQAARDAVATRPSDGAGLAQALSEVARGLDQAPFMAGFVEGLRAG